MDRMSAHLLALYHRPVNPAMMISKLARMGSRNVFSDGERLYTRNSVPGNNVYGERLVRSDDSEYRDWSPTRSKLAAYIVKGGASFPFSSDSNVLYLGAASGTTASHVSDIISPSKVYCIELSSRSFRDLVAVCEVRTNMVPILADATKPNEYAFVIESIRTVYQDVAQKGQVTIFVKNFKAFGAREGLLVIKARSEDVSRPPYEIYREAEKQLRSAGLKVIETVELDPLEKIML